MSQCKVFLHVLCFTFMLTLSACHSDPETANTASKESASSQNNLSIESNQSKPTQPTPALSNKDAEKDNKDLSEENNITDTDPAETPPVDDAMQDLQLHYYAANNQYYRDIVIEFGEIRYTFFNDTNNRCRVWKKKTPCWNKKDLQRIATPLQQEEIDNLLAIIDETQLMALAKDEYGINDPTRPDAREDISVRINAQQRQFSYFNTRKKSTKPTAFAALETALLQYGRNLQGTYLAETLESNTLPQSLGAMKIKSGNN